MVAASEYGYLELLLQRALPGHHLKVRSLAWEGDTVFEQPRDLNYPTLEAQLEEVGATVVIMQFGQMESLAGTSKLPEFIKAYEKLIERVGAGGKRRVALVSPRLFERPAHVSRFGDPSHLNPQLREFANAANLTAAHLHLPFVDLVDWRTQVITETYISPDGVHLGPGGHRISARGIFESLVPEDQRKIRNPEEGLNYQDKIPLLEYIAAKNRLWFHYYRPQNWAFLAGDRTEQPSSRDHKDPSKRWFPEEMKQWLPLIDAKEKEIWALAAKSTKP